MYMQFDGVVYQRIVSIPMNTNRLISILLREGFYVKPPEIQTVWPHKTSSTIPLDILTIYSPMITLILLNIFPILYPREFQFNKANTSDKETSFLDLNIKVIGSYIHTSVYDNINN